MALSPRLSALLEAVRPERPSRIADVGARDINVNPYMPLVKSGHAEVWGFEPAKDGYAELIAKAGPGEHYLPDAVGDGTRQEFKMTRAGGFSSLLEPSQEALAYLGRWTQMTRVAERIPVETKRLDDMADLPRLDLLKIDVQGAELQVFQGGRDRLSEAVVVISEVAFCPFYEDQPSLGDQMVELSGQGFILHKFLHQTARVLAGGRGDKLRPRFHRNQLIDGDAVFVRDMRKPDLLSDAQLGQLAILADVVFESFDLSLRALDHLVARGAADPQAVDAYLRQIPYVRP